MNLIKICNHCKKIIFGIKSNKLNKLIENNIGDRADHITPNISIYSLP